MELTKILEYQKIDMGVYRQEREFNQSKERELLFRCKKTFEEKKVALANLAKELDNTLLVINKLTEKLGELSADEWENFDVDSLSSEEELLKAEKRFNEFESKITEINKELSKAIKREEEIAAENKRINDAMESLNTDYMHISAILEKKKAEMVEKIKPALIQLKSIAPQLDKSLYEKYIELRKGKKMPAIVVYNEGCCGACGMDISIEVNKKLVEKGDIAECPHCGRIVYKR
ncbi:MAG: zinc ribbon domain-containing protein [Christensenellales bacterium]